MIKVEMLDSRYEYQLQNKINDWIEEHDNVLIQDIKITGVKDGVIAMIIYVK